MMRNTSLKDLPSAKALGRALLVVSGVITWLGGALGANAANCITGVPSFQLELFPSGTAPLSICQTTPIAPAMGISGPGFVSDAEGIASVGSLGAIARALGPDAASVHARFKDDFPFFSPGSGVATLEFTAPLSGSLTGFGADVAGFMGVIGLDLLSVAGGTLHSPGTQVLDVSVLLGFPDTIDVTGDLIVDAFPRPGFTASATFLDSLDITNIQLFDLAGHLLDGNVVLADAEGRVLPVASPAPPSPPSVPEPSAALLLTAGIGLLAVTRRRRRAKKRQMPAQRGQGLLRLGEKEPRKVVPAHLALCHSLVHQKRDGLRVQGRGRSARG